MKANKRKSNKRSKKKSQISKIPKFEIGDFVFAKLRGFAPWPSIVREIKGTSGRVDFICEPKSWYEPKKYKVSIHRVKFLIDFFRNWVPLAEMFAFTENSAADMREKHPKNFLLIKYIDQMEFCYTQIQMKVQNKIQSKPEKTETSSTHTNEIKPKSKKLIPASTRVLRSHSKLKN